MIKKLKLIYAALLSLILYACGSGVQIEPQGEKKFGAQAAVVDEVRFRSGNFRLVGELRSPEGGESHPAIVTLHGSGDACPYQANMN